MKYYYNLKHFIYHYLNIVNVIYSCVGKAEFSASLLHSLQCNLIIQKLLRCADLVPMKHFSFLSMLNAVVLLNILA